MNTPLPELNGIVRISRSESGDGNGKWVWAGTGIPVDIVTRPA